MKLTGNRNRHAIRASSTTMLARSDCELLYVVTREVALRPGVHELAHGKCTVGVEGPTQT